MAKLLICIDDDEDDLQIFTDALNEIASTVTCITASTGKQGLDQLRAIIPDWIFLDINMPGMSGIEVLKEIRSRNHLDDVPVIMFSTTISNQKQLKLAGSTDFLIKPSGFTDLCKILRSFVLTDAH